MPPPVKTPPPTSFDPLATPFDTHGEVDLLLDLGTPADAPGATAAERHAYRAARGMRRGGEGRPVLVVDASPIARKFLLQRLQALGYDAQAVDTGERALALIRQRAFAIVFIELTFGPDAVVDGLALCQAVKHQGEHANGVAPAIVITTGQTGSTHRVRGSLAGCDAFLNKPLIEAEFLDALRDVDPLFR
jgi:CheY-like chemotaxis protein